MELGLATSTSIAGARRLILVSFKHAAAPELSFHLLRRCKELQATPYSPWDQCSKGGTRSLCTSPRPVASPCPPATSANTVWRSAPAVDWPQRSLPADRSAAAAGRPNRFAASTLAMSVAVPSVYPLLVAGRRSMQATGADSRPCSTCRRWSLARSAAATCSGAKPASPRRSSKCFESLCRAPPRHPRSSCPILIARMHSAVRSRSSPRTKLARPPT